MKRLFELGIAVSLIVLAANKSSASADSTNDPVLPLSWPALKNEIDLELSLFVDTNKNGLCDFDESVCKSLPIRSRTQMIISYQEISFVFHHPSTNDFDGSNQEMGRPDNLIDRSGIITRTKSEAKIPVNYIRIADTNVNHSMAEVDLLLGVASLERPQDVKYFRRSFRFVYSNGWRYDGLIGR